MTKPSVHFHISMAQRNAHIFDVTLSIPAHDSNSLALSLPNWLPGSYMIRDFAKHIVEISAKNQSGSLSLIANNKSSWTLATGGQACEVKYQVFAFDTSVRTAFLNNQRAFFNGSSVFLAVEGMTEIQHQLTIDAPTIPCNWRVATGLKRSEKTELYSFGDYYADNYAHLIDCPVEICDFDTVDFSINGITHYFVISGKHYADLAKLASDIEKICQLHCTMFMGEGNKPPFDEYWFLTNVLPNGFGGLEHKNSTALLCSTFDLANNHKDNKPSEAYTKLLSLCSHEYFHAWNVCRIKPTEFVPYQLDKEQYTEQLWAFEGITSYYDDLALYRAGLISFADYLTLLANTYSRVNRGHGELKQSAPQSSFYAWTKFYQQGEDAINNIVSYYTKGALLALWLDLNLRLQSNEKTSLDQLMQHLWLNFGITGVGTKEADFIDAITLLSTAALANRFKQLLHSAERIDFTSLFHDVGISAVFQSPKVTNLTEANSNNDVATPYLGFGFKAHPAGLEINQIMASSPAQEAGLNVKDVILAIDGLKVDKDNLTLICQQLKVGTAYPVHFFRNSTLQEIALTVGFAPQVIVKLTEVDNEKSAIWRNIIGKA